MKHLALIGILALALIAGIGSAAKASNIGDGSVPVPCNAQNNSLTVAYAGHAYMCWWFSPYYRWVRLY